MTNFLFLFGIFAMKISDEDKILCQLLKSKIMVKNSQSIFECKQIKIKTCLNVCMSGPFQRQVKAAQEKIIWHYEYNINQCFTYQENCHLKFSLWFSLCITGKILSYLKRSVYQSSSNTMCIKFLRMLIVFDQIFPSLG